MIMDSAAMMPVADRSRRSGVRWPLLCGGAIIACLALDTGGALAQDASDGVDSIVVTAQRREQAVIDVPLSVTVLSSEDVEEKNLTTFTSVAEFTPNFNITQEFGGSSVPSLTIRGIRGDSSLSRANESSVAVYVDDVYLGDESMLSGSMFDVERVEVLRGPQGTLFGRNTTGGLVHFVSVAPEDYFAAKGSALYGSDDWVNFTGAINVPLGAQVRTRLAAQYEAHDGHYNNRATISRPLDPLGGKEVWSVRSTTDFDVTETTTLRLQALYSKTDSQSVPGYGLGIWEPGSAAAPVQCSRSDILAAKCQDAYVLFLGEPPQSGRRAGDAITEQSRDDLRIKQELLSFTAKLESDFDWASLISITNYTKFDSRLGVDGDAATTPSTMDTQLNVRIFNTARQFSQELRLQGATDALDWVTGVFYYKDEKTNRNLIDLRNPFTLMANSDSAVDTHSTALFAQADWHATDQLTLTAGARYSWETRHLKKGLFELVGIAVQDVQALVAEPRAKTRDLTGKIGLTWEPTSDNTIYASYSRGAKSVGFNLFYGLGSFGTAEIADAVGPVGQEKLNAFEIGSKNRFFNGDLTVNGSIFYYLFDGKQEQLSIVQNVNGLPVVSTQFVNVGEAELYGAELELTYSPSDRWDFQLSGGLLHTEITNSSLVVSDPLLGAVPLEGLPIPRAPKWNASGLIAYHIPTETMGRFTLQAEASAMAKQNFDISNNPLATAPSYMINNFRIMWKSAEGHYNAQAFVTNAFNKAYFNTLSAINADTGSLTTLQAEPRVWGVKFGVSF